MRQEAFQHLLQVQQLRLAIDQGHHIHTKGVLQLRLLIEIVQYNLRHFTTFQLDHDTHTRFIGFIANIGDTFEFLVAHVFSDTFQQGLLIHLVWQLINDDGRTTFFTKFFKMRFCAHDYAATASAITIAHTRNAINQTCCWEVGRRNNFDQFIDAALWITQDMQSTVNDFSDIVRRNIGRHTHRNTGRTVNQQIWNTGWQY